MAEQKSDNYKKLYVILAKSIEEKRKSGVDIDHVTRYELLDGLVYYADAIVDVVKGVYSYITHFLCADQLTGISYVHIRSGYEDVYVALLKEHFPNSEIDIVSELMDDNFVSGFSFKISADDIELNKDAIEKYKIFLVKNQTRHFIDIDELTR